MDATSRIVDLRRLMAATGIAATIVPSADPHLSEYLPERWQGRRWLSGFTGSAGTLVVTADFAGLWTDSRYFVQAECALAGSPVQLVRQRVPHAPEHLAWLAEHLPRGAVVAVAGDTVSLASCAQMNERFATAGLVLRTDFDALAVLWTDRPPVPAAAVREHDPRYRADGRPERLQRIREAMAEAGTTHHLVSALDDVAWITALRGSDVPYNPLFVAHLLIGPQRATLFVGPGKIAADLAARLAADGIDLAPYAQAGAALAALPAEAVLLVDPRRVTCALAGAVPGSVSRVQATNPSQRFKALKNATELDHLRRTMERDGVAMVRCLRWIGNALAEGRRPTELELAQAALAFRSAQPGFVCESFATIAGYQANGALPHYRATPEHHARIEPYGFLVFDSGGQYEGGTTDITRTLALGETTAEQRADFTRVLKGMIALSRARFPRGTSGAALDALARAPIWADGINYGHGTGHGVGYFLGVHEGPQAIRPPTPGETAVPLEAGMVTSNEPGIYRPGKHGVRIENLIATVPAGETEFGEFLAFETLTLCPIDRDAIDPARLDAGEIAWLDAYHDEVFARLAPLLDSAERAWLGARCAPL